MSRTHIEEIDGYKLGRSRGFYVVRWEKDGGRLACHRLPVAVKQSESVAKAEFGLWLRQRRAAQSVQQKYTVGQIIELYFEDRRVAGKSSVKRRRYSWGKMAETFGDLRPDDVDAPFIVQGEKRTRCHAYAVARDQDKKARDTISTELILLRTALNWAKKRQLIDRAPVVWIPKHGKVRDEALTADDVLKLIEHAMLPHIHACFMIALFTGARKSAITDLRWSQVDFERNTIDFRRSAIDEVHILDSSHIKGRAFVDMHPALRKSLLVLSTQARTDFVIEYAGRRIKDPARGVMDTVKRAGLDGRRIGLHTFRHLLATWAADNGVDMRKIQKMLGHHRIETTQERYASHTRGYVIDVANAASNRLLDHTSK
jgi:integrase